MQAQHEYASFSDETDEQALVPYSPRQSLIVRPIARPAEMRLAIQEYEDLKSSILQKRDVQIIKGRPHIKKSGWLRIARAFGVTVHPVSEHYLVGEDGRDWGYEIVVRAEAPNGASMPGDGACWASEKDPALRTRHNVRAHAYTRATNRAIANLVGGGDVSAEELTDYTDEDMPAAATEPRQQQQQDPWEQLRQRALKLGANEAQWLATKSKFKTLAKVRTAIELKEQQAAERLASVMDAGAPADDDTIVEDEITFTVDGDVIAESNAPDQPIPHDLRGLKMAGAH